MLCLDALSFPYVYGAYIGALTLVSLYFPALLLRDYLSDAMTTCHKVGKRASY